jgi:hypothetical protein
MVRAIKESNKKAPIPIGHRGFWVQKYALQHSHCLRMNPFSLKNGTANSFSLISIDTLPQPTEQNEAN